MGIGVGSMVSLEGGGTKKKEKKNSDLVLTLPRKSLNKGQKTSRMQMAALAFKI